jgi:glycerate kinase
MRVLVACDKFKDALTAREACAVIAETLQAWAPQWIIDSCPLADGGEGFAEILTHTANGKLHPQTVTGPRGAPIEARFGLVSLDDIPAHACEALGLQPDPAARVAIIEMASASGLGLLSPAERNPWETTSAGTGDLIRAAADLGAAAIVLGIGGSATNDLGLGALARLGVEFLDEHDVPLTSLAPVYWPHIARIGGRCRPLPPLFLACDVTNPLLGTNGATAVYGPQKGLQPADRARLEHEIARLGLLLCSHFRQPDSLMDSAGAGAAGGMAFGLTVAASAQLLPGFDFVARWFDLEQRISAANLVITGEGRFDATSTSGKAPGNIIARSFALEKPVYVFAGAVETANALGRVSFHSITPDGTPLPDALRDTRVNLAATVRRVFDAMRNR